MNRISSVLSNGVHSPKIPVVYGLAQGSILGPLLFISYVNELNYLGDEFGLIRPCSRINTGTSSIYFICK